MTPSIGSPEEQALDRVLTREILTSLPPRERRLIVLRFFMEQTQSATAKELGMSQVAVSRLEKKILTELKSKYRK